MKFLSKIIYILVFLVMVTSPYAGHTYAEYASEASGSDTARITKFGATVTATSNAFAVNYAGAGSNSSKNTVTGANSAKVLAPGTSGTFCSYSATGTPEVRIRVTKTATITMNDYWTNGSKTTGSFYCPIVFTIGSTTINGLDYTSKDSFIADLETALELGSGEYDPGFDLSAGDLNRNVTWSWPFSGATGSAIQQTEANDNDLGDKGTRPNISVAFEIKVEQID